MKQKRTKANRKTMNIFTSSYGFREPFRILVDADFVLSVIAQKLEIAERLQSAVCGPINPMITQCCLNHLYDLGPEAQPAVELARDWNRWKCNHWQTKATTAECLLGVIGESNARQFCVATQSLDLRSKMRDIPGVPLIYINPHSVLILEPPSEATIKKRKSIEDGKLHASSTELASLQSSDLIPSASTSKSINTVERSNHSTVYKTAEQTLASSTKLKAKKKKGGVNPLSVKKKKSSIQKKPKVVKSEGGATKVDKAPAEGVKATASQKKRMRKRARKQGEAEGSTVGAE